MTMVASRRTACNFSMMRIVRALLLMFAVLLVICYLTLSEMNQSSYSPLSGAAPQLQSSDHYVNLGPRLRKSGSVQMQSYASEHSFEAQIDYFAVSKDDPSFESKHQIKKESTTNAFKRTKEEPVSTFSADVDTSSYSYIRRMLQSNFQMPASNTVRTEELINYFEYDYPSPQDPSSPLEASVMISNSPWSPGRKIMSIGIKGYDPTKVVGASLPKSNLVFLVDVSGSMGSSDCLPLVKESLELLVGALQPEDNVSIVTYASGTNLVLRPTLAINKGTILRAIRSLEAGGSTNGSGGLELAYQVASQNYDPDAINRVMLFSDGDFNVGLTSGDALTRFISEKRDTGIFLSVFGYGMSGQYQDGTMKALANHGNGVAVYIDSIKEAQKVLVQQASSTIHTIAKDVKFQVEFNPNRVAEYRLMGYEKRLLAREDFHNDAVDAGEIGAGHTVTVLYEFTPVENDSTAGAVDDLRYGRRLASESAPPSLDTEYAFLKMRYKLPKEEHSELVTRPITDRANLELLQSQGGPMIAQKFRFATIAKEFRFAIAVAGFAELLKLAISPQPGIARLNAKGQMGQQINENPYWTWSDAIELAEGSLGKDPHQYRREFVNLVRTAKSLVGGK